MRAWFSWPSLLIAFFLVVSWALLTVPSFRDPIRDIFRRQDREILSVAVGRAIPDQEPVRIVKVRTPAGLQIEVYGSIESATQPLLDTIQLPEKKDGFIQFLGRSSNLALKDMDGDRVFEILVPTYTASLAPRVHILRYNRDSKHFEFYVE